jgi:hypothetical protein
MNNSIQRLLIGIAVLLALFLALPFFQEQGSTPSIRPVVQQQESTVSTPLPVREKVDPNSFSGNSSGVIENAYRNRTSGLSVMETGIVSQILSDDNTDSRHQRFIVRLGSGHSVLIAHNIDIAPRINNLSKGDQVTFSGVYEWNDRGGVVHWTHHDPSGRHAGGHVLHNSAVYQ